MKHTVIALLTLISAAGCKHIGSTENDFAYIGGQIINPKNDFVMLYDNEGKITDTLFLDTENRFIHKINNLNPGLHSFTHGGEYQMVLLEPGDSIMFRLNTYGFDESLVFTGNGARKNNYLLKSFLTNESEDKKLVSYSQMEPEAFLEFVENRRLRQLKSFEEFCKKKPISPLSKSIIEASINYNNYADKEIYPFAYFGNNKLMHVKDLPESFYDHRAQIDYNAHHLREFFAYNRFLFSHFDNLALKSYYKDKAYHSKFNRHEISYNKSKLDLIDSLVNDISIKNNLLKYKTRDFISHNHSDAETEEILAYYLNKTTNEEDKAYMKDLVNSLGDLKPGKEIPLLRIVNLKNEESTISDVVKKPTLIYFWSTNYIMHYRNSHYKVKQLRKQFPNAEFISININSDEDKNWKSILEKYNFSLENEYKFKNPSEALKTLAVNYVNKVIVVDKNAHILHPNVNIFESDFDITLKELMQKKELSSL